ncbi:DedA family protein [Streptosporangium roseum]|uniref:Membrane-associated protein-like protein n=1 Tax=Streptosporangium roseum (strain ATCC 12428 / DSM 43021 / JCM 3005 / KCTC 9067 / NCIMB 10171 / NRRL 2505 / NI 9100) TaxID=479432 RepID=D2ARG7_STRRD|nr:VTT domain-containing protein [Streptosporangium roseum]ACZ90307.1 membrane-associated protein-like protein [Streptosporangium roseum DSM 43021]
MRLLAADITDPNSLSFLGMPLWLWVVLGGIGLFGAFQVYYWVGYKVGPKLYASRLGRKVGDKNILKVENAVRRWGALAVYGCFWVPGLRHTLPWVAGVLRISYPWYAVASALGCLTWVPVTSFGLYSVIWGWLRLAAESPLLAGVAAVAAVALVAAVVHRRRRRRASQRAEEELTKV